MKNSFIFKILKFNRYFLDFLKSTSMIGILWFLSSGYIIYLGFQPYHIFGKEELQTEYPMNGVILTLVLSSIYYLYALFDKFFLTQHIAAFSQYLSNSCIIIFLLFITLMGAMHSPPYWYGLLINFFVLSAYHFMLYPILLFIDKFIGAKYLA